MDKEKTKHDTYRKYFLNKMSANKRVVRYIENYPINDEAKHIFHKIMVHNWLESEEQLYELVSQYFKVIFVPINYTSENGLQCFHTSSLNLILKVIMFDFVFPYRRDVVKVEIILNDKTSIDFFGKSLTIDNIVYEIVTARFSKDMELDLSNFCNDQAFTEYKIKFYKLELLANFKILMLRMSRDTRILNLSNNNLIHVPLEILNFFIKGDLVGLNLSNNNISSIQEQFRVNSKIERLWLEGNPLCEHLDMPSYVKQLLMKFPRLIEIDGVRINEHGVIFPFFKYYSAKPDKKTKMVVQNFIRSYFDNFDTKPRSKIGAFYDKTAALTVSSDFSTADENSMPHYAMCTRNALDPDKRKFMPAMKIYNGQEAIVGIFYNFPQTIHDPKTFSVDVLRHDSKVLFLVVDGVYKEIDVSRLEYYMRFRRTFIFKIYNVWKQPNYRIVNEMFSVTYAEKELLRNCFKSPIKYMHPLSLIDPTEAEIDMLCRIFVHITSLRLKSEARQRLKAHSWNIKLALENFIEDMVHNRIRASQGNRVDLSDVSLYSLSDLD